MNLYTEEPENENPEPEPENRLVVAALMTGGLLLQLALRLQSVQGSIRESVKESDKEPKWNG